MDCEEGVMDCWSNGLMVWRRIGMMPAHHRGFKKITTL